MWCGLWAARGLRPQCVLCRVQAAPSAQPEPSGLPQDPRNAEAQPGWELDSCPTWVRRQYLERPLTKASFSFAGESRLQTRAGRSLGAL